MRIKGDGMKIRCKNCYHILKPNEEYCTSCGAHSIEMQQAMLTGDYGPDALGKCKIGFSIYILAGFVASGFLQIIFAMLQNKEIQMYTNIYTGVNSLFYSSILVFILMLIVSWKDMKKISFSKGLMHYLVALGIGLLVIVIVFLLGYILPFSQVFPRYVVEYLQNGGAVFWSLKEASISKIIIAYVFEGIATEVLLRKRIVDALDETMLGEKAIASISILGITLLETAWIMSLDVLIPLLLMNIVTTLIYMNTDRNVFVNVALRVILVVVAVILFV